MADAGRVEAAVSDAAVEELTARLKAMTNLRVIEDPASATGYKLDIGPFPGWKDVPTW